MHENAVIISGVRTAVCKFGLGFKDVPAQRLGAIVITEALKRSGLDASELEERKLKRGLVTLCLGGGNAVAMLIEG